MKRKKAKKVFINKDYIRRQIHNSRIKYDEVARLVGRSCEGSLSGAISTGEMAIDEIKKLARILDFPYEKAIKGDSLRLDEIEVKDECNNKLDKILSMQIEINNTLLSIIKEGNQRGKNNAY